MSEKQKGCSFPFKQLVVDYEGDILPCCKMGGKKLKLGNIKSMTLFDAWNSAEHRHLQKIHSKGNWKSNPVCLRCMESMGL